MTKRYYYGTLNKAAQSVYDGMYACFTELGSSVRVLKLPAGELAETFNKLKLDCPEIFYVTNYSYRFAQGSDHVEIIPEYLFDKGKIREQQKALSARVKKLLRPALELKSDVEKEQYIHDFVCENVKYDKLKKPYSHEVTGPLTNGVGVCEGIAKTVKLLCDEVGIECIVALCENDPENGAKYRHAWNVVKINGRYYHLDATFDNTLGKYGAARYDYFNLDDKRIFRDHRPLVYGVPACSDSDGFWYRQNRLSLTKTEDVRKRAEQCIKKKKEYFIFHWRGGYLTRDVLAELLETLDSAAAEKGKQALVSVNFPQAVLKVSFADGSAKADVETECAEEEEE